MSNKDLQDWTDFVDKLNGIAWLSPGQKDIQATKDALQNVYENKSLITARTQQILNTPQEYDKLAHYHSYPRILMDKMVLYIDPADRFRIRLHRFNGLKHTGGAKEKTHSHKWPGYSVILSGSYIEQIFSIAEQDISRSHARLELKAEITRREGDVDFKPVGQPHNVSNSSHDDPCYTLFIRGSSAAEYGMMYDLEDNSCRPWYAAEESLRTGLRDLGEFRADFY